MGISTVSCPVQRQGCAAQGARALIPDPCRWCAGGRTPGRGRSLHQRQGGCQQQQQQQAPLASGSSGASSSSKAQQQQQQQQQQQVNSYNLEDSWDLTDDATGGYTPFPANLPTNEGGLDGAGMEFWHMSSGVHLSDSKEVWGKLGQVRCASMLPHPRQSCSMPLAC